MQLTVEYLHARLTYYPETGMFVWNDTKQEAGWTDKLGYVHIRLAGKLIPAHRLAWLYMTDKWPDSNIDHRDHQPGNNRWENLREATQAQNVANARTRKDSKTGIKGVSRISSGKYRAQIQRDGRLAHLGVFETPEDAHHAYLDAAKQIHGEFACGGV